MEIFNGKHVSIALVTNELFFGFNMTLGIDYGCDELENNLFAFSMQVGWLMFVISFSK